jgi:hypothetical protein
MSDGHGWRIGWIATNPSSQTRFVLAIISSAAATR